MKRILLVFLLIGMLGLGLAAAQDGDWLAPPEVDGEIVYIPFSVPITLDGDLSDWAGIQPVTVTRGPYTSGDPANNGSFTFGVAADAENFYIYMTMPDQNIITDQHGADYWNEDSLEFYLNLSGNLAAPSYTAGIFQINIKPLDIGNPDPAALNLTGTSSSGVPVSGVVFLTEDGWGLEAATSLAHYGITPEHGLAVGFQAQANGATEADRDSKLIWSLADTIDNSWQNPSLFGTGVFFEVGRTDVPAVAAAPVPTATPVPEVVEPTIPGIRVNQVGYFPAGAKLAVRVAAEDDPPAMWSLVDLQTDEPVLDGETTDTRLDRASGDYVQIVDFSAWTQPGEYMLAAGEDTSPPFRLADDIYDALAIDALRYFYLNRSGIELASEHAGDWARAAGHLSDAAVTCFKGVDAEGTDWPGCDYEIDGSGGWYDAGDYGKYMVNGGITLWTLHSLYERFPLAFPDGSLNIPESGNGVPDILDEARWEMEWMLRMQVPDGDPLAGMAFHKLHDQSWSALPSLPPPDYDNDNAHTHPTLGRYVYGPSTAATLNLAATAAQCARIWTGIDPDFSAACLAAAETAWNAALEHPALLAGNTPGEGGGNYEDGDVSDEFAWAAAELYVTTQDPAYLDQLAAFSERAPLPGPRTRASYSMHWDETAALGMISLAAVDGSADYRAMLVGVADDYLAVLRDEGYRLPMDIRGYVWGSNSGVLNNAMILALAYDITGDPAYLDGVVAAADYVLGRNALSTSFVTGYGAVSPEHVHHRFWANQGEFPPPPPGALAGGPNAEPTDPDALNHAILDSGPAKRYVDMIGSYSTNEVAINWNAPLAWVMTYLDQQFGAE